MEEIPGKYNPTLWTFGPLLLFLNDCYFFSAHTHTQTTASAQCLIDRRHLSRPGSNAKHLPANEADIFLLWNRNKEKEWLKDECSLCSKHFFFCQIIMFDSKPWFIELRAARAISRKEFRCVAITTGIYLLKSKSYSFISRHISAII